MCSLKCQLDHISNTLVTRVTALVSVLKKRYKTTSDSAIHFLKASVRWLHVKMSENNFRRSVRMSENDLVKVQKCRKMDQKTSLKKVLKCRKIFGTKMYFCSFWNKTYETEFDEFFRILKFRIFLGHFCILSSWKFSDVFTHGSISVI